MAALAWATGLEARHGQWWPAFDAEVMVESLREVATDAEWDRWAAVRCPTLVIRGEHGALTPDQVTRRQAVVPGTEVVEVPRAGHDVHLDEPACWRRVLQDFLGRHGAQPPPSSSCRPPSRGS